MPRVLIAGCGYVGKATADLFERAGWEVEGWTSRDIDISDRDAVHATAADFDVVIQAASSRGGGADDYRRIYLQGARNLSSAFPDALHLFASSTSVYAQTGGEWVDESSPAEPQRESGRVLREAEDIVLSRGGIVARLGGVYGPGRSALLRRFLNGEAVIESWRDRYINQAHRDDIAAALFLLVERRAAGQIFNVTDNHPIPVRECYEWLARELDRPAPAPTNTPAERKRGNSNKRVSSNKLLACGWAPRFPTLQIGMRDSVLPNLAEFGA
ncbi:MAG TPA: NAD-dependent epimerase/dehydratase family protein [Chthoniobacterales bacterium]|nr:NAD-dependent epimerase/dehydratase family protein [Chthoniobacterales bacterium]